MTKTINIILIAFALILSLFGLVLADTSVAPADIMDLEAVNVGSSSAQFKWTAPGADGLVEPATSYDFRMATSSITLATWGTKARVLGTPTPGQPGTQETFTLTGLTPSTAYYFAIRGVDSLGVLSQFFNIVATTTLASGNPGITGVSFYPKIDGIAIPANRNFTITLYNAGTASQAYQFTGTADSNGKINLPTSASVQAGNYDILIYSQYYLKKKLLNYNLSSNANVNLPVLPTGDLNGDNTINSLDWSVMRPNWFTSNSQSDLNKDGLVNSIDRSYLIKNWMVSGDN